MLSKILPIGAAVIGLAGLAGSLFMIKKRHDIEDELNEYVNMSISNQRLLHPYAYIRYMDFPEEKEDE